MIRLEEIKAIFGRASMPPGYVINDDTKEFLRLALSAMPWMIDRIEELEAELKPFAEKAALNESIAHWIRMRVWARKQKQSDYPGTEAMEKSIGENWGSDYCALCKLQTEGIEMHCDACVLGAKFGSCGSRKENDNAWFKVLHSTTWAEWDRHATTLIEQLRSLEE